MASTYSSLKIQLMATGENSGTWGNVTNDNLGVAIEEAIAESADVAFSGSNVSITLSDTNASQTARNLRLNVTGTGLGATTALTVPDIEKPYIVNNGLSDDLEVKNSTGANVTVPAGKTMWVYSTGAGVVDVVTAGENLTGLNASNVSSGTLSNARTTASSSNSASTIVARDASGDFTSNKITSLSFMSGVFSDKLSAIGNLGATNTLTASNGTVFTATLDQSCTLTVSGADATANRSSSFTLILTRGAGGPFTLTLAGGTFYAADGTLSPTTTDGSIDIWFFFTVDGGSNWYVSIPIKNAQSI